MTNTIFQNEVLTEEQLDTVSGGDDGQERVDTGFFMQLGYDPAGFKLKKAFEENGVDFYNPGYIFDNYYRIKVDGEWKTHPHWAALGYVLAKKNYPGFTGNWADENYTKSFLKNNFHIKNFG